MLMWVSPPRVGRLIAPHCDRLYALSDAVVRKRLHTQCMEIVSTARVHTRDGVELVPNCCLRSQHSNLTDGNVGFCRRGDQRARARVFDDSSGVCVTRTRAQRCVEAMCRGVRVY